MSLCGTLYVYKISCKFGSVGSERDIRHREDTRVAEQGY